MKLLLTSAGVTNNAIAEAAAQLVSKPLKQVNVAVINEGYVVDVGHRWVVRELSRAAQVFGGVFDIVDLLALSEADFLKRLEPADLIYVLGGYTDYLMSVVKRSGLARHLPSLLESRVYLGSSAGSMILGRRVSTREYQQMYGEGDDYGVSRYLELVDFAMKPHLNSPQWEKNRPEKLAEVTKDFAGTVYGVPDECAIMVDGSATSFVGDGVVTVKSSHLQTNH